MKFAQLRQEIYSLHYLIHSDNTFFSLQREKRELLYLADLGNLITQYLTEKHINMIWQDDVVLLFNVPVISLILAGEMKNCYLFILLATNQSLQETRQWRNWFSSHSTLEGSAVGNPVLYEPQAKFSLYYQRFSLSIQTSKMPLQIYYTNHSLCTALPQVGYRQPTALQLVAVQTTGFQPVVYGLHLKALQEVNRYNKSVVSRCKLTKLFTFTGNCTIGHKWKVIQTYLGFN